MKKGESRFVTQQLILKKKQCKRMGQNAANHFLSILVNIAACFSIAGANGKRVENKISNQRKTKITWIESLFTPSVYPQSGYLEHRNAFLKTVSVSFTYSKSYS